MKITCIQIAGRRFYAEIAQTQAQQERGLQFRTALSPQRGMVFPYTTPQPVTFWMKDCDIPLDMLFFRDHRLVDYVDAAPPCHAEAAVCPRYTAKAPADTVVELLAGTRVKYGFQINSPLSACHGAD